MEYEFFIDTATNTVFERFVGNVSRQNFIDATHEYPNHPDWKEGRDLHISFYVRCKAMAGN